MIENPFAQFLGDGGVVILDGALATELERRGANLNDALWSARILLEDPDLIRQVHFDYLVAGADVITTASYQATFEGFARRGLAREQAAELMRPPTPNGWTGFARSGSKRSPRPSGWNRATPMSAAGVPI